MLSQFLALTLFATTFLSTAVADSATRGTASRIADPLAYANRISERHSEGDTADTAGWRSCTELDNGVEIMISCEGHRTLLIHGGHATEVPYSCEFRFTRDPRDGFWLVESESWCQ